MIPLVSILIPAYNAEKWIDETIQSALNQTWPSKELIIVDDGSTDNTLARARRYERGMVKVVSQQNRGASAARNRALSQAQGDYIQWLDADDLLASDKISLQLLSRKEDLGDKTLLSSAFGEFFSQPRKAVFNAHVLWQDLSPVEWISLQFQSNNWMVPSSWLVSRRLTDISGPWDERLSLDDDGEYFCRVVSVSKNVVFTPRAKSYYRVSNMGSMSKSTSYKAYESRFLSLTLRIGYLRALEDSEKTRKACLSHMQSLYGFFYPENKEIVRKMNDLAVELGGSLMPPKLRWEYSLLQKLFGWKIVKGIKHEVRITKLRARMARERLSYSGHL